MNNIIPSPSFHIYSHNKGDLFLLRRGHPDAWWSIMQLWRPPPQWCRVRIQWRGLKGGCWTPTPSWRLLVRRLSAAVTSPPLKVTLTLCSPCRQCLYATEQQQQPLWKVHPASARQVPTVHPGSVCCKTNSLVSWISSTCLVYMKVSAVGGGVCADVLAGEDQGGLPAC